MTTENPSAEITCLDLKKTGASLQATISWLKSSNRTRERSLVITRLEEATMWIGKDLVAMGDADLNAERDAMQLAKAATVKAKSC